MCRRREARAWEVEPALETPGTTLSAPLAVHSARTGPRRVAMRPGPGRTDCVEGVEERRWEKCDLSSRESSEYVVDATTKTEVGAEEGTGHGQCAVRPT